MRKIFNIFLILLVLAELRAQTPVQTIRGTIKDRDSHQPLAGASIIIVGAGKNQLFQIVRDSFFCRMFL
jgi:hypothetical protein